MSSSVLKRNPCKRSPALSLQGLQAIISSPRSAQRVYVKSKWAVLGIFLQIHHKFTAHFLNGSVKSKRHGRAVPLPETHTLQKDYALVKRLFTGIRHIGLLIYMHFCVTSRRFLLHYLIPGTTILKTCPQPRLTQICISALFLSRLRTEARPGSFAGSSRRVTQPMVPLLPTTLLLASAHPAQRLLALPPPQRLCS